jgi:hypothetical protein
LDQHEGDVSSSLPLALLKVNVIKNEANDMAHYSPLDNADQSNDVARQPDDKVVKAKIAPNKADKNVVEHSTADADHSRGQGSTDHNPTMEESTTQVVTATDFPAQLEGVKNRTTCISCR